MVPLPLAVAAAAVLLALAAVGPGCSWIALDERRLAAEMVEVQAEIEAGAARAAIPRLEKLAWRRRDSVAVRRLLVEACRKVDTIESRRVAESALRELTVLEPENPDLRFELAEVLIARGFDLAASRQLDRVLERAPGHARAHLALGLYHQALYRRYGARRDLDLMLGYAARAANLDPDLYPARAAQVEATMLEGQWESALRELERLRERWPDEPWLDALAGACLARPGTYPEAAEAFERAFARLTPAERVPFESLRLVANPYDLERFEILAPDEREDFLRIFWRSKDPMPVTRVNERQVEHWRRVVMADLLYAHRRLGVRGWDTARGEMYIRYGPPIYTEYTEGHAALISAPGWYHIYEVNGEELEVTFYDTALSGLFYLPFTALPTPADLAAYTEPEGYAHDFGGRWIAPAMQVAGFAGAGSRTRAEVYLAVAVDSLAAYAGSSLEAGTVVFDREWNEVARREETLDLDALPTAGEAGRALVHEVNLELAPGDYIVSSQLEGDGGAVVGTLTRPVVLDRFDPGRLELSVPELAFAVRSDPGPEPFRKGGLSVVPNPTGEVQGSELLVLYFEIYNLETAGATETAGAAGGRGRYEVRTRIAPADRAGRSLFGRMADAFRTRTFVESSFQEESPGPTARRHLTIDVSALPPDRYRLDLEVTDLESGSTAARRLDFVRAAAAAR